MSLVDLCVRRQVFATMLIDDLRGRPRRLLVWRPTWRPRPALRQRLETGLNGRRKA